MGRKGTDTMKIIPIGASLLLAVAVATPALAQPMSPSQYVTTAGASDLYEQQSSQLVLQTTQDPNVRAFANEMIGDHGKSTAMVKSAAMKSGVSAPPPALMPAQQEMIAQLQAASRAERDAAYLAQQKAAHGQALAVQMAYAKEGGDPALRSAAANIVPVVEHHIMMLKAM